MFERFTEESRKVVVLAQEEARGLKHNYIGTEHILLGLLREEEGSPAGKRPLQSLGVGLAEARRQIERIVGPGEELSSGSSPFTPRAKKVLELALREALNLGHNYIGPDHILLGLTDESEGAAARVLLDLGVDAEEVRAQLMEALGSRPPESLAGPAAGTPTPARRTPIELAWFDGLQALLQELTHEIRRELGRDPDSGDLLLALACARDTLAGEALGEVGVDLDVLWGHLERLRPGRVDERKALIERINEVRAQKLRAVENQQFAEAAKLRDEQRELTERALAKRSIGPEVVAEIRRRLGLPNREA